MTVVYASQQKSKLVKGAVHQKLFRAMVDGAPTERLAGIVYRDPAHRTVLHRLMCHRLSCDCAELCGDKQPSVPRKTSTDDPIDLNWDTVIKEWQQRSTLLYEVLEAAATKVQCQNSLKHVHVPQARHLPSIGLAGSILLFHRNPKVCRVQFVNGLILDMGGATDEVSENADGIVCNHKLNLNPK